MTTHQSRDDENFVCDGCIEIFPLDQEADEGKGLCESCSRIKHAGICLKCKRDPKNYPPLESTWGSCQECWDDDQKTIDRLNRKLAKKPTTDMSNKERLKLETLIEKGMAFCRSPDFNSEDKVKQILYWIDLKLGYQTDDSFAWYLDEESLRTLQVVLLGRLIGILNDVNTPGDSIIPKDDPRTDELTELERKILKGKGVV